MGLFKVGAARSADISDTRATLLAIVGFDDESIYKMHIPKLKTTALPNLNNCGQRTPTYLPHLVPPRLVRCSSQTSTSLLNSSSHCDHLLVE